jgi:hypothetical protein
MRLESFLLSSKEGLNILKALHPSVPISLRHFQ